MLAATMQESDQIVAVDLFCGAGGLTCGLHKSGVLVAAGVDLDKTCEYAYTQNNPEADFIHKSVKEINKLEIEGYFSGYKYSLLCGCAPCQTFSSYNQKASESDERWWLLSEFGRLVNEVGPTFVTMENVPQLLKHKVFEDFLEVLESAGYCTSYSVIDCTAYGIPQTRNRLVLLASKLGPISIIHPTTADNPPTLRDAIGHLSGEEDSLYHSDSLHVSQTLSPQNLKRIKASKPGGTWRDWDMSLRCKCHSKSSGKTYSAVYGRMEWDKPSPTITTQFINYGSGRFGHPEKNRALSLREGALIQTFPEDYCFSDQKNKLSMSSISKLIGNAVPPQLGQIIGLSFKEHLNDIRSQ